MSSTPQPAYLGSLRTMASAARSLAEALNDRGHLDLALEAEALAQRIDDRADDEPTLRTTLPPEGT